MNGMTERELLALVPDSHASRNERWEAWKTLGAHIDRERSSSTLRCYRAGCGLEGAHVRYLTLDGGRSVCSWCRAHGSARANLTALPTATFFSDPAGTLDYVFVRHGGTRGVRALVRFLRRHHAA